MIVVRGDEVRANEEVIMPSRPQVERGEIEPPPLNPQQPQQPLAAGTLDLSKYKSCFIHPSSFGRVVDST
jgi:hypothetical protein